MAAPGFWDSREQAQKQIEEASALRKQTEPLQHAEKQLEDLRLMVELGEAEPETAQAALEKELAVEAGRFAAELDALELGILLSGPHDRNNCILSINAGAGGTESCDWAAMLLRMYIKWAEGKGFEVSVIDQLSGEEAGIKNATLLIKGDYSYGFLKSESGVHRLVRISPFDSNKRRHTSFASIDVLPEISDNIQIDIKESDLKIDTYRAGGSGGQHVNKTDSAVRITHIPTGMVVQCQNERSQFKNKQVAMKMLKAKLYEKELTKKARKIESAYDAKKEIAWGSQIRSYVLHPYSMVKDHRTDHETGNSQAVLDGKIDPFIEAYLKTLKSKS
jgi:peptide chain release factor 2